MLELLVVVGILLVLLSLLLPVLVSGIRRGKEQQCGDNLRRIGIALGTYADNFDSQYPFTYNQLTTAKPGVDDQIGTGAMDVIAGYLGNHDEQLFCPLLWVNPEILTDRRGPHGNGVSPNWYWGYDKYVATQSINPLNVKPLHYSRYQDITRNPASGEEQAGHSGYMTASSVHTGKRHYIVRGNRYGGIVAWQSAYKPDAIPNLGGPAAIPPSEIAFFGDTNNCGARTITASHLRDTGMDDLPSVPPAIYGKNELKADGRVAWYGIASGSLYYVSDGRPFGAGIYVQDNR